MRYPYTDYSNSLYISTTLCSLLYDLQNPGGLHWLLPICIARHMAVSKELLSLRGQFEGKIMDYFQERKPDSVEDAKNREPVCVCPTTFGTKC